jgi:hypothetical protein
MWRRRQAAQRMVPLGQCGCVRDPVYDRHRCGRRPLTEKMIDAGADAARHFLDAGYPPIFDAETLQALSRRRSTRSAAKR